MTDEEAVQEIMESAREGERTELTEYESKQLLSARGIPIAKTLLARNKLEAVRAARIIKYPIVAKIASPEILHKSDVRGVKVGLASEIEVRHAFDDIIANAKAQYPDAETWGITVQEFIPRGREVIIGVTQDPSFGPTLMFGLGGIWVEVLEDVSFRLPPISDEEARKMIQEIKGYPTLTGARGGPPADIDALSGLLQKIGQLVIELDQISEIDLNPVFVLDKGEGAKVADARVILKEPKEDGEEE